MSQGRTRLERRSRLYNSIGVAAAVVRRAALAALVEDMRLGSLQIGFRLNVGTPSRCHVYVL